MHWLSEDGVINCSGAELVRVCRQVLGLIKLKPRPNQANRAFHASV